MSSILKASMYFAYGRSARPGLAARTTFEAVLDGTRTSTTRFARWPGHARWAAVRPGDRIAFHPDRAMAGVPALVVASDVPRPIDLAACGEVELEAWSLAEGWTPAAGRDFGRRLGLALQVRYRLEETSRAP